MHARVQAVRDECTREQRSDREVANTKRSRGSSSACVTDSARRDGGLSPSLSPRTTRYAFTRGTRQACRRFRLAQTISISAWEQRYTRPPASIDSEADIRRAHSLNRMVLLNTRIRSAHALFRVEGARFPAHSPHVHEKDCFSTSSHTASAPIRLQRAVHLLMLAADCDMYSAPSGGTTRIPLSATCPRPAASSR